MFESTLCKNPACVKTRQDLKDAWETILRMDRELKLINIAIAEIEARQDDLPGNH